MIGKPIRECLRSLPKQEQSRRLVPELEVREVSLSLTLLLVRVFGVARFLDVVHVAVFS